jgi:hypothetical protein
LIKSSPKKRNSKTYSAGVSAGVSTGVSTGASAGTSGVTSSIFIFFNNKKQLFSEAVCDSWIASLIQEAETASEVCDA